MAVAVVGVGGGGGEDKYGGGERGLGLDGLGKYCPGRRRYMGAPGGGIRVALRGGAGGGYRTA